jgi:predicted  nucleic acid-binding Zn-ribbon protein
MAEEVTRVHRRKTMTREQAVDTQQRFAEIEQRLAAAREDWRKQNLIAANIRAERMRLDDPRVLAGVYEHARKHDCDVALRLLRDGVMPSDGVPFGFPEVNALLGQPGIASLEHEIARLEAERAKLAEQLRGHHERWPTETATARIATPGRCGSATGTAATSNRVRSSA